jgi:ABC-type uncharacterized transport system substrate-binding protein
MLLALCSRVDAQQQEKIFRIGFLDGSSVSSSRLRLEAFWREIRKLGWIEGKNITIESRFAEGDPGRLPELAAELVRLNIDLIVVVATPSALAAKNATATIPIVMTSSGDPVGAGLVASLSRPGGNVTGMSTQAFALNTKKLEILKDTVPKLARLGYLRLADGSLGIAGGLEIKEFRPAAAALSIKVEELQTQLDPKALESAFQTAQQRQVGAIVPSPNPLFFDERKRIVELARKYRFPAIYPQKEFVDEGGLMSYGVDYGDVYRGAAVYVDKILKGAKPADLPVQQATKFEFIINLKAAKQIGLTIPVRVLERANQVIK